MTDELLMEAPPKSPEDISTFRAQIDQIDDALMTLLRKRMEIVKKVGALKHQLAPGKCPLRPGREAQQIRSVVKALAGSDIYPPAAAAIWRNLIMASLRLEGDITISICAHERWPYLQWLARDYFGAFSSYSNQPTPKRVIGDLLDGRAQVAVLPMWPTVDESMRWWPELAGNDRIEQPKIFAHLPFVFPNKPGREVHTALAVGMVTPEETGDDVSLFMLESEESTSTQKLQAGLAASGLNATWIDVMSVAGRRRHLVQFAGFVTPDHMKFKVFIRDHGASLLNSFWLGAYANPVVLGSE